MFLIAGAGPNKALKLTGPTLRANRGIASIQPAPHLNLSFTLSLPFAPPPQNPHTPQMSNPR
jgi:hypothetical protein